MNLAVVVPSRGRPGNARRLADAFRKTADFTATDLTFAVNDDDPELDAYRLLADEDPWASLTVVPAGMRVGPILNELVPSLAPFARYVGFMGDDHLPKTKGWDGMLTGTLEGDPGVAYGNDLHQGANLPTACVISSGLIQALGYFVPPVLEHLYFDDFWKLLGSVTRLVYVPEVIIEHLHPQAGKADVDATYQAGGLSGDLMVQDGVRWQAWLWEEWPAGYAAIKRCCGA